jgi:hypothetical protein
MDEKQPELVSNARVVPDVVVAESNSTLVDTRSAKIKRREYVQYATLCVSLFLAGTYLIPRRTSLSLRTLRLE